MNLHGHNFVFPRRRTSGHGLQIFMIKKDWTQFKYFYDEIKWSRVVISAMKINCLKLIISMIKISGHILNGFAKKMLWLQV